MRSIIKLTNPKLGPRRAPTSGAFFMPSKRAQGKTVATCGGRCGSRLPRGRCQNCEVDLFDQANAARFAFVAVHLGNAAEFWDRSSELHRLATARAIGRYGCRPDDFFFPMEHRATTRAGDLK